MSARLDHLYEEFCGPNAIWPMGETIDVRRLHDVVLGLVVEMRALESALGSNPPSARGLEDPAQIRTPEESSRSSSEPAVAGEVAETAKESASSGPAPTGSGRGPRRSTDVVRRPVKQRKT